MIGSQLSPVGRFDKILLATDGSEFSAGATRVALAMAAKAQAQLLAMTVVLANSELVMAPDLDNEVTREARATLAEIEGQAAEAGVACSAYVRFGDDPYKTIVKETRDTCCDLVVLGRRGRRGLARMMVGDATRNVIGHAPCSALVVPKACAMWSSVLLATDGSRSSDAAAITAARIAHCCEAPLAVLSVKVPSHSKRRQAEAPRIVERVVKLLEQDGIPAAGIVETGEADTTILAVAERRGADLIVLGSHGRTGLGRLLFGSKSERVIQNATCPVMVVKAG